MVTPSLEKCPLCAIKDAELARVNGRLQLCREHHARKKERWRWVAVVTAIVAFIAGALIF